MCNDRQLTLTATWMNRRARSPPITCRVAAQVFYGIYDQSQSASSLRLRPVSISICDQSLYIRLPLSNIYVPENWGVRLNQYSQTCTTECYVCTSISERIHVRARACVYVCVRARFRVKRKIEEEENWLYKVRECALRWVALVLE